jgi:hypothetical protein
MAVKCWKCQELFKDGELIWTTGIEKQYLVCKKCYDIIVADQLELPEFPESPKAKEAVNHPDHYNQHKWEVIEVLEEFFKNDPLLWQVGKYILRYKHKEKPFEDLKKALWYLQYKIDHFETTK